MLSIFLKNYNVRNYKIFNSNFSKTEYNVLNCFPIYVINLEEDVTRRNYIKKLFKKYGVNYSLIIVKRFRYKSTKDLLNIKMRAPILGCVLSHLWCIQNAVYNNYDRFIIFEDDIVFHKNFNNLFKKIVDSYIQNIDLLMLGALDINLNTNLKNFTNDEVIYYPTNNIAGAHANIYKLEFAQEFLNYKLTTTNPLEFDYDYYLFMNKFKIGICMPNLVVCELSTTNINHVFSPLISNCYERYKTFFPKNFTYDDYEYITILFINFIKEQNDIGNIFNTFEEMVKKFSIKYKNRYTDYICKSIVNSGYKKEDIFEIITDINNDNY